MIYFDNAATTMPCEEAVRAVAENMRGNYGNASSLHKMGIDAEKVLIAAKKTILSKLNAEGEIFFTSGATESNNTALVGCAEAYKRAGSRIVTTGIEHPSVSRTIDRLEEKGFEFVRLMPKDYPDFEQAIIDAVDEKTIICSFMAVNNEIGFKIDTKRVYSAVKRKFPKCVVHVDGVQGFCKVPLSGDIISLSAHKIHGPKGVGVMYVKKGVRFIPLLCGGEQQKNLRPGTEPVDLVAGLSAAIEAYPKIDTITAHCESLSAHLRERLSELDGITINSFNNVPNILSLSVAGVRSEIMLHYLEERGIFVSSGSACAKGKQSGVLTAFGIAPELADSTIRISFSRYNTLPETDEFVEAVSEGIKRFRR